ncbi:hypothetical protein EYF80_025413 [Liparis tanakae]|uniref:Uncharacterized protein n=1 Tax=Liparis tanakae TaxID=230148 RepID=A0A4Z2HHR2_9TELE|nr:hypothetical protein EYF80_025413 [Liparis tanakae]
MSMLYRQNQHIDQHQRKQEVDKVDNQVNTSRTSGPGLHGEGDVAIGEEHQDAGGHGAKCKPVGPTRLMLRLTYTTIPNRPRRKAGNLRSIASLWVLFWRNESTPTINSWNIRNGSSCARTHRLCTHSAHSLAYVFPSLPHTGARFRGHARISAVSGQDGYPEGTNTQAGSGISYKQSSWDAACGYDSYSFTCGAISIGTHLTAGKSHNFGFRRHVNIMCQ